MKPVLDLPQPMNESWQEWAETVARTFQSEKKKLYRIAQRRFGSSLDDLDDAASEMCLKLIQGGPTCNLPRQMHQSFPQRLIDQKRKNMRHSVKVELLKTVLPAFEVPTETPDLGRFQWIYEAMQPAAREVVSLFASGLKYEEIAEVLGVNLGTVRSRLHRARDEAAQIVAEAPPELIGQLDRKDILAACQRYSEMLEADSKPRHKRGRRRNAAQDSRTATEHTNSHSGSTDDSEAPLRPFKTKNGNAA